MAITFSQTFPEGIFEVHNTPPLFAAIKRVKQTHSDIVLTLDHTCATQDIIGIGDGIIDQEKKYHLAILTADCIPLLFLGLKGNAMVHAGWAGVKNKISLNNQIISLDVHTIFIGPHIRLQNFEVQEDFRQHFKDDRYYHLKGGKLFFDLTAKLIDDLKSVYPNATIIDCALDTKTDERFHSFRRNKTILRNWNIFKINEE